MMLFFPSIENSCDLTECRLIECDRDRATGRSGTAFKYLDRVSVTGDGATGRVARVVTVKSDPENETGKDVWAVFDTGSERSYITRDALPDGTACSRIGPFSLKMGGEERAITERCSLSAEIEGKIFDFSAHPVDTIGEVEGQDTKLIIGATAMEEWDIKVIPMGRQLDLSGLEKREFVEL
jgi:hypothetical protein